MLPKPKECEGCPWFQDGQGFVPDEINSLDAPITFCGQNPGKDEEAIGRPFVGRSGAVVENNIAKYGVERKDCNWLNVLKCRWNGTDEVPDGEVTNVAIRYCTDKYLNPVVTRIRSNVIVPLGEIALAHLAGRSGITHWRGSVFSISHGPLDKRKCLPTIHPAYIFQDKTFRGASKQDFSRIIRESKSPQPVITYADNFRKAVSASEFIATLQGLSKRPLTLDIETKNRRGYLPPEERDERKPIDEIIKVIGVAWSPTDACNYLVGNDPVADSEVLRAIEEFDGEWRTATPFDYTVLTKDGVRFDWAKCHDLTLLHSRFDCELKHTVEFIASTWTNRPFWKWMSGTDLLYYNLIDCVAEWEAFENLVNHCKQRDREVLKVYEADRQLIPVAVHLHLNGMPFSEEAYDAEKDYYEGIRESLENSIANQFAVPISDQPPKCETHPRYTGKTDVKLRKGEESPCKVCNGIRQYYRDSRPVNLRSRKRLAGILRAEGKEIPRDRKTKKESLAKGKVADLFKKYQDPKLAALLEFWENDTVMVRYFKEAKVTPETGRIHSIYAMHAAKHRWSCKKPNMQQQKKPEEE